MITIGTDIDSGKHGGYLPFVDLGAPRFSSWFGIPAVYHGDGDKRPPYTVIVVCYRILNKITYC